MSGSRRIVGLALCLVVISVAVVGGWSARPPARAADTVDLPPGFIDAPENSVFLKSLAIPEDKLTLVLSMRDTTADGQPPFWAEVQALMIVEQEREQWEWALTETGAQHTYRDMVKQMKPILDLYIFLSKASIGWAYGSASIPGIIGDYLRVKKWISTWNAVGDMMEVIDELRDLPDPDENDFIGFAAQEDVEVFPGNWDVLSVLAPDMDEEEGKALAHHIYVVVNDDVEADKRELADKLHELARHSGVTIADLRQLQAGGVTRIQTGDKATGDEIVVSATIASPSAPVRLEVVTRTTRSLYEGSRNYETGYGPGGTVTLSIPLADYEDGEYVWLARAADQSGGASSWTSFGDNLSWNADFVVGDVVGNLTTAPTVKLTPKSDGASPGIVLEWTAVVGAATYDIYRDNLLLYSTRTAGTTFWNTGLTPGRSYGYRVLARNGCLRGPLSATVSAVAPAPDTPADQARVVVDSNPVPLDVAPTNVSGSLLVPIRAISEALGAQVSWDQVSQTATLTLGGTVVKLVLGSKQATVNGKTVTLTVAAANVSGRILVPLRFVGESFGAEVAWKQETQTVVIIGRREGATPPSPVGTTSPAVLRYNLATEPQTLDSALATGAPEWAVLNALFEGLCRLDGRSQPQPAAAASWGVSSDGLTYTFHLRAGMKWSNGDPVTAEHFKYAWLRVLDPRADADYAYQLWYIKGAEEYSSGTGRADQVGIRVPDPLTLQVTLAEPTPYFLSLTASPTYFPVHRPTVEASGRLYGTEARYLTTNGPFKLDKWEHRNVLQLSPFDGYWDRGAVRLTGLFLYIIEEASTELAMFETGELDVLESVPTMEMDRLRASGLTIGPHLSVCYYIFNCEREPFDDVRVRKAFSLAVNRRQLIDTLLRAGQRPALAFVPYGILNPATGQDFREEGGAYFQDADVAKARQLLADAGYPNGEGLPPIEILYSTAWGNQELAETVAQMWKGNLGVRNVVLRGEAWGTYLDSRDKGDFQVARGGWAPDYYDPMTFLNLWVTEGGNNDTSWGDSGYDTLIARANSTSDSRIRFDAMHQAEAILMRDMPIAPFYFYADLYMLKPYVKGFIKPPFGPGVEFKWVYFDSSAK